MKKALLTFLFYYLSIVFCFAQLSDLRAYWDDGLKFESKNGLYKLNVGGRVHYDACFIDQSKALDTLFRNPYDNVEVRRARLSFSGSINDALAYEFEFTFGETIKYADLYFAFLRVPYFERITVGHFREPFGMEEMTSSNAIVFMERSLTSAFGPSRNTGIMLQRQFFKDKLKGYAGIFRITNDLGTDTIGKGRHSFSSRWVYNPIIDTSTNKALHIGVAVHLFTPQNRIYEVKTQNENNISPSYINSGNVKNIKGVTQVGGEFGYTKERLCLQSEYVHSFARQQPDNGLPLSNNIHDYNSFYIMGSYFLKGGTRKYNKGGNRFSSIGITAPYEKGNLGGAWEVGLRFSHIRLDEAKTEIREMSNITAGVNWYFNSNSRIMMNYILTRLNKEYFANALQFRIQVAF